LLKNRAAAVPALEGRVLAVPVAVALVVAVGDLVPMAAADLAADVAAAGEVRDASAPAKARQNLSAPMAKPLS